MAKAVYSLAALVLLAGACSFGGSTATATPAPPPTAPIATNSPTPAQPLILLVAPGGADPDLQSQVSQIMADYAAQNDLRFETRPTLGSDELSEETQAVVLLGDVPGADELVAAAPDVRFVVVGASGLSEQDNLTVLSLASGTDAEAAFVAGYVAALVTDDWRVGVLTSDESVSLGDAFVAGARYFCGSCVSVAPPYVEYPLAAQADPANWRAGADELLSQSVRTIYLAPELENPDLIRYLSDWGVLLIGNSAPPEGLESNWLASVNAGGDAQSAIAQLPALLSGGEPSTEDAPLSLNHVNQDLLSAPLLDHVHQVVEDLMAGYLSW